MVEGLALCCRTFPECLAIIIIIHCWLNSLLFYVWPFLVLHRNYLDKRLEGEVAVSSGARPLMRKIVTSLARV